MRAIRALARSVRWPKPVRDSALMQIGNLFSTLDAVRFRQDRRAYYEYLAYLLKGTAGTRTLKQVFSADAVRYGAATARGRLSRRWLDLFQAAGGDLYSTWYGVFPLAELAVLRSAQMRGNEVLMATLEEMSRVLGVIDAARSLLLHTLLTAFAALAVLAATLIAVPFVTVPRLRASFSMIPAEFHGAAARALFEWADRINSHWVGVSVALVAFAVVVGCSFGGYVGPGRKLLDRLGPWRVYRQVQALRFLALLAVALGKDAHGPTRLRIALSLQLHGASRWLAHKVRQMLRNVDAGQSGSALFDTGLLDPDQRWFLDDMISARGLVEGLRRCSERVERHVLGTVARQAVVMRWCLLLVALAGVMTVALWHYAAVDDLRRGLSLFHATQ